MKNMKKGFTLIELIVVIAIISVISLILIPSFLNYIDSANVTTDKANLRTLNLATALYKATIIHERDIFEGLNTDSLRQSKLVEEKYTQEVILPRKPGSSFYWDSEKQVWAYSLNILATESTSKLVFSDLSLKDYRQTGSWKKTEEGFVSGGGNLFLPNPEVEYTISSVAKLLSGTNGGYGLLVETSLTENNRDSGYSIQLDRGLGGIVIRKRTNSSESSVITSVYNRDNNLIPASKSDDWWTKEHTLKVEVRNSSNPNKKIITVYINNEKVISKFEIDANPNPDSNFTGFRSWNGYEVTYKDLEITK